jgi:hypothetical protein
MGFNLLAFTSCLEVARKKGEDLVILPESLYTPVMEYPYLGLANGRVPILSALLSGVELRTKTDSPKPDFHKVVEVYLRKGCRNVAVATIPSIGNALSVSRWSGKKLKMSRDQFVLWSLGQLFFLDCSMNVGFYGNRELYVTLVAKEEV